MSTAPTTLSNRLAAEEGKTTVSTPDTLGDSPPAFVATPTDHEVDELVTYIREASAPAPEADIDEAASYWIADTMSPLTAQSAVSPLFDYALLFLFLPAISPLPAARGRI